MVKGATKLHEAGGGMKQVEDMRKELQNILVTCNGCDCNGSENIFCFCTFFINQNVYKFVSAHFLFHHFFPHIHANDMNESLHFT
jgi:hypothetical protein